MKILSVSLLVCLQSLLCPVSSLECYVCYNQDGNTEKCTKTIKTCEYEEDRCLSTITWSTTPYWTQAEFSPLIGRAPTRLGSHWSRASEC